MRLRRVFFTWNNYDKDFENDLEIENYFKNLPHIKGYVIGKEIGEKGTPHLQGVVRFSNPKSFNTLREYFKNNHIEKVIDLKSSINYCMKDNDFIEFGDMGLNAGKRTDLTDFRDAIIDGYSDLELLEEYPNQFFRFQDKIQVIREMTLFDYYSKNNRTDLKVIYLGGMTGAGKTSFVYQLYNITDVYRVSDYTHPFDNYKGEKVLVLDEFNSSLPISLMLNLLDIYPMQLPARYRNKMACFETVFIISNKDFDEQYSNIKEQYKQQWYALKRRIDLKCFLYDNDESRQEVYSSIKEILYNEELPF